MTRASMHLRSFIKRFSIPPVTWLALVLIATGLVLGAAAHKGFLILLVLGAFGPNVLRQFGLLDDFDEYQKEAAAKAGLRAYLAAALFLMVIVIGQGWNSLSLDNDQISASTMVTFMLVIYYASYCLSFWDARRAVSLVLFAFGLFWLVFVILSHAGEPTALVMEGLVVPGPFILCAILCRWWPRIIGLVLLCVSVGSIVFFNLLPFGSADPQEFLQRAFVIVLIPLPLAIAAVALLTSARDASVAEPSASFCDAPRATVDVSPVSKPETYEES